MRISENEQLSHEWKKEKYGLIGGTSLSDLMVSKPVTETALYLQLLAERSEEFFDDHSFVSNDMQRGIDLEPEAVQEAEKYLHTEFKNFGWCTNEKFPLNGCSPDGFSEDLTEGIEVKCPKASTHIGYILKDEIPKEYFWQVINYFLVNEKLKTLHFVSYRPENTVKPLWVKTVHRDRILPFKIGRTVVEQTIQEWVNEAAERSQEMQKAIDEGIEQIAF
jgi:hypothetical protein